MTKEEFKTRWESDEDGGGITWDDVAECCIEWGICSTPRTRSTSSVLASVLKSAGVEDAEYFGE